jgi:protein involved in polysaccharide export with SLBB domain
VTALGLLLMCVAWPSARAQEESPGNGAHPHQASRGELEALAVAAEQLAASDSRTPVREQKRIEAEALRARLRDGDVRVGDRIVLSVRGDSTLTDTFTVHPGRMLHLPNLPALALSGVLRSELQGYLTLHIARYVKDPVVDAYPLIRLGLLGEVTQPGFYFMTTNDLVADAIMRAGGPTREADIARATVRRGSSVLWDKGKLRDAVVEGITLDQLGLRSGDEIVVGERRRRNWETILRNAGYISGIVIAIYGVTQIGQ